ncbi:hypothetical protein [Aestuariibaculum sediminum]|uniref:Uncharacterized protein n=1 Tax=Aestuariibaculum sediminum TaxID=2770637 RepID=A0A8J6UEU8_9FLAO|nr:hypothetical protein [Aestuariibaculum sediminum]MBD0831031.1 hypothetical protein [Aestuariibaculum sediminum]
MIVDIYVYLKVYIISMRYRNTQTIKTLSELNIIFTSILFLVFGVISAQTQPPLEEVEKLLQKKITDVTALIYEGETISYAELMTENAVIPFFGLTGKEEIKKALTRLDIPRTDYTIDFSPIVKIDSTTYVTSYTIKEPSGFTSMQSEIWKFEDGQFKIVVAHLIGKDPPIQGGISKPRFFISALFLGVFSFLLLLIFKNAWLWKRK